MTNAVPNRLGRSAWLVLLAGMLASAGMVTAAVLLEGYAQRNGLQDLLQVYAVALAIACVTHVWALVLAGRAILQGEPSRLPILLVNFMLVPPAIFAAAHWFVLPKHVLLNGEWFLNAHLPVLLPFLALAIPTGTVLSLWLTRWAERRRASKGQRPSTRRRRWRVGIEFMLLWMLLLGGTLLPVPLFIHALRLHDNRNYFSILERTPDYFRDIAESSMAWLGGSRYQDLRNQQLYFGYASVSRLRLRVADANQQISDVALTGLSKRDPRTAAEIATQLVKDSAGGPGSPFNHFTLQNIVAEHGTHLQRKELLEFLIKNPTYSPRNFFFEELAHKAPDADLIPLLEAHLQGTFPEHECALSTLISWLPEDRAEALMKQAVDSSDTAMRDLILEGRFEGRWIWRNDRMWLNVMFYAMEHKDIAVRKKAWFVWNCNGLKQPERIVCMKRLLKIMDGTDIVQRRAAFQHIILLVVNYVSDDPNADQDMQAYYSIRDPYEPLDPAKPVETGGAPRTETPEERDAFEKIRAGATRWLERYNRTK